MLPDRILDLILTDYVAGYDNKPGNTLSEKVEHHLLSIGVKQEEINTFKEIMIE